MEKFFITDGRFSNKEFDLCLSNHNVAQSKLEKNRAEKSKNTIAFDSSFFNKGLSIPMLRFIVIIVLIQVASQFLRRAKHNNIII